jgi:hypothetical protein
MANETGHVGQLLSLAGVAGVPGRGRESVPLAVATAGIGQILPANPRRISAIVQNKSDTVGFRLYLGDTTVSGFEIKPGGTFQIDGDFPWTGLVLIEAVGGTASAYSVDVSVP